MSVIAPFPVVEVTQGREQPSLTYRLDFEKKRIVGRIDSLGAVNQCIHKALKTPRFRCLLYDNQYGSEIKETIVAEDVTPEYIEAEIPRLVEDALSVDSRILSVRDLAFEYKGDMVHISFTADTTFGETYIEEVF